MNSLLDRRIIMAHLPTPVHFLPRLSEVLGISLFVKRDDLTESVASGNKLRKMEYLLFDARERVLFVHTGGHYGLFPKHGELARALEGGPPPG